MSSFSYQTVLPNEEESTEEYINNLQKDTSDKSMLIFTDGFAQINPGPTGSPTVIKKQGLESAPIKKVKAISSRDTSFEGELEAIYMGTEYAKDTQHLITIFTSRYTDSQAAIKAIIGQS